MSSVAAIVAVVALAAMSQGARAPSPREQLRGVEDPRAYGASKLPLLRARWNDPAVRSALARWGEQLLPHAPTTAMLGLTASSVGPREGANGQGGVVGWWNVARRYRSAHAADARTIADLRRPIAATDPAYAADIEGQGYLGMRSQLDAYHAAVAGLPEALRGAPGSPWGLRLGAAAYSSGPALVRALVGHYSDALASVPEGERWAQLRALVARDARPVGGIGPFSWAGRWQLAHTVLRSDERAEAANALARAVAPSETGYLGALTDDDTPAVAKLRRLAQRRRP